jgi:hypothetical protein
MRQVPSLRLEEQVVMGLPESLVVRVVQLHWEERVVRVELQELEVLSMQEV